MKRIERGMRNGKRFGIYFCGQSMLTSSLRILNAALLATLCFVAFAAAERGGDQGVGVMLGNPSGFSYKMWLDDQVALDGAAGIDRGDFDMHASLLWHNFAWSKNINDRLIKGITDNGDFPFYFGFGPRVLFAGDTEFGIRFPLGLSFLPHDTLWEFFFEVAPVLRLTPDAGFNGDFAIGARYYFPAIRPRTH